jgi:hypothetical protein
VTAPVTATSAFETETWGGRDGVMREGVGERVSRVFAGFVVARFVCSHSLGWLAGWLAG